MSETKKRKIQINFSINDETSSYTHLIDSSFTIQQTLQFFKDRNNDQNLQYVYINGSIIYDLNDLIFDWNDLDPKPVFNFRHSKINNTLNSNSSITSTNEYNFTIFTSASWESLTKGKTFFLNKDMNRDQLENQIQDYCSSQSQIPILDMKLFVFLPGGIEFTDTTLKEYVETAKPEKLHIYVVIAKGLSSNLLNKEIVEICDVRGEMSILFSPLTESSDQGKQLFACLLSSLFHQTVGRKELLKSLSKITGFPPLIASMHSLINRKAVTGKDLIIITTTLFTIFNYFVDNSIAKISILESCTKLCNLISQIDNSDDIPLENHSINSTDDTKIKNDKIVCIDEYMQNKNLLTLTFWKPDFEGAEFNKKQISPFTQNQLQNAWEVKQYFKPIMPLNLFHVHTSSIIKGPNGTYRVFVMDSADAKEIKASSKVDLIDPGTGKTTHEDIETFAKSVKDKKVDGEKIELIDEESVKQITMVLIDQSGSMRDSYDDSHDDSQITRDLLAKQLLTSWASKSFAYRISSLHGLISFSENVNIESELSPLIPDFEKSVMDINPIGGTDLFPAIKLAAEKLVAKKIDQQTQKPKFINAKLRILILTDGEDNSNMNAKDLIPYLIQNEIIVDVVIVSLTALCQDVCTLAKLTGGLAFKPSSLAEGIALFEKEAFLSISYRENPKPFENPITEKVFNDSKSKLEYDKEPKNELLILAKSKLPLSTPKAAIKGLDGTSQSRFRRIAKELRFAYHWPDQDVKVFPVDNLYDRWRIYIKGPESTLYKNKWWDLFVSFPENYPYSPPIFRFITVPFHINISDEGRICMNTLGSSYSSSTKVMELVANIKSLLMLPNYSDPIDIAKSDLYHNSDDHHEFIQKIRESVQKAKDNFNSYMPEIDINYGDDYVVPQEKDIYASNRSPISGKPLDPINTVYASSKIKYDLDDLKLLLRSSNHPRCVITNEILTDNPDTL